MLTYRWERKRGKEEEYERGDCKETGIDKIYEGDKKAKGSRTEKRDSVLSENSPTFLRVAEG